MRSEGQPPSDRIVRVFLPCPLSPRRRRHDRFSPIALSLSRTTSATFAEAGRQFVILRSRTRNRCGGQQPCLAPKSKVRGGGRNARATSRARARFWMFPPAIRSRESPAAAGSAAIIRQSQELSRFAEPTLIQFVAPRKTKSSPLCAETVDVETSLWKNEEN